MMAPDMERVVEQYHQAVVEIVKGSADGFRRAYSRRDDVTLANPFGPPARGWEQVGADARAGRSPDARWRAHGL